MHGRSLSDQRSSHPNNAGDGARRVSTDEAAVDVGFEATGGGGMGVVM